MNQLLIFQPVMMNGRWGTSSNHFRTVPNLSVKGCGIRTCNQIHVYYSAIPNVHSLKLTYPLKIDPWKRRFLLDTIIFRGYVSFREGTLQKTRQSFRRKFSQDKVASVLFPGLHEAVRR